MKLVDAFFVSYSPHYFYLSPVNVTKFGKNRKLPGTKQ